jgi:hypothetical protein
MRLDAAGLIGEGLVHDQEYLRHIEVNIREAKMTERNV